MTNINTLLKFKTEKTNTTSTNKEEVKGKRIVFIDLAKGICITLVVLYHVFGDLSGDIINMMTLFRMPLYFVLSGLFFKPYNGFFSFFKKKVNKLLIPFLLCLIFFNIPTSVIIDIVNEKYTTFFDFIWEDGYRPNLGINKAIWFLLCLFLINLLFYTIFMIFHNNIFRCIVSFICGFCGWYIGFNQISLPIWIDTAFTATPFFLFGYLMRHYGNILYSRISYSDYIIIVLCLITLIGIFFYNKHQNTLIVNYIYNEYEMNFTYVYLGGFVGTYLILILSKILSHVPIISYIGKYSIVVLITHQAYRFFIRNILYQMGIPQESVLINISVFIIIMLIELPSIKYGIRYLPVCFAQKDLWK